MSIKGIFRSTKAKAQALMLGLKILSLGFAIGMAFSTAVHKFMEDAER